MSYEHTTVPLFKTDKHIYEATPILQQHILSFRRLPFLPPLYSGVCETYHLYSSAEGLRLFF